MQDQIINEAVDEAKTEDTAVEDVAVEENEALEGQEQEKSADKDAKPDDAEKTEEKWPKKAENALSRQKKENHKLRSQLMALQQQQQQLMQSLEEMKNPKKSNVPQEQDFESVLDYLKAQAAYEANKATEDKFNSQTKQQQELMQQQQFYARREQEIVTQAAELSKAIPDLDQTIEEHEDVIAALPQNVREMFLSAQNPPLAAYNLIKEGKLEALAYMHPQLVAAEIVRAQSQMPRPVNRVSAAPKPISGISGVGNAGKSSINTMTPDELIKWVNS